MHHPVSELVIDPLLMRKYGGGSPHHACYPGAERFVEAFGDAQLRHWLARRNIGGLSQPLLANMHLTPERARSTKYIKYLQKELELVAPLLGAERCVCRVHWSGAGASGLARAEMGRLMAALERALEWAPSCERSLELEARRIEPGSLAFFAGLGFNAVALAVQGEEEVRRAVDEARAAGFRALSLELAYGQPRQTLDGFSRALERAIALDPERIALRGDAGQGAPPETELQHLSLAIGRLARAGYLHIGMNRFVRPDDELAQAQMEGRLLWGFLGYSTHPPADVLGLGAAALGRVGPACYQNCRSLDAYYAALDAGRLPVGRGLELSGDDLARRALIEALTCNFRVSIESLELAYLLEFRTHFAAELRDLRVLAGEGLVEFAEDWILVTPRGKPLLPAICAVFDRYRREERNRAQCAKLI